MAMKHGTKVGPQMTKFSMVSLTSSDTKRVREFARTHGQGTAMRRLGISRITFENALEFGLMRPVTRETVLAALAREEAIDAGKVTS